MRQEKSEEKMEISLELWGFFSLCADELVNDRLIPLLSLHAVKINTVNFPDWSITSNMPVKIVS